MGSTIFHDIYSVSKWISQYLPMSDGLPLDREIDVFQSKPIQHIEGEHWVVVSKTGNGKTTFDKALDRAFSFKYPWLNHYYLDCKKQGDFSSRDGKLYATYEAPPPLTGIGQKQVWQPQEDDIDEYSTYFGNILRAGKPAVVLIDESKNLKFGDRAPKGYELLLSQGRMPGIHTITNAQEVAKSPRQAFSQPTHIISFSVWNEYDERMMLRYLRIPDKKHLPLAGKHSFLYLNPDKMSTPKLFRDYKDFVHWFMEW